MKYFTKKAFNFKVTRQALKFFKGEGGELFHESPEFINGHLGLTLPNHILRNPRIFISRTSKELHNPIFTFFHELGHYLKYLKNPKKYKRSLDNQLFFGKNSQPQLHDLFKTKYVLSQEIGATVTPIKHWGHLASDTDLAKYFEELDRNLKTYKLSRILDAYSNFRPKLTKQVLPSKPLTFYSVEDYINTLKSTLRQLKKKDPKFYQFVHRTYGPLMRFKYVDHFNDIWRLRGISKPPTTPDTLPKRFKILVNRTMGQIYEPLDMWLLRKVIS